MATHGGTAVVAGGDDGVVHVWTLAEQGKDDPGDFPYGTEAEALEGAAEGSGDEGDGRDARGGAAEGGEGETEAGSVAGEGDAADGAEVAANGGGAGGQAL